MYIYIKLLNYFYYIMIFNYIYGHETCVYVDKSDKILYNNCECKSISQYVYVLLDSENQRLVKRTFVL